MFLRLNFLVPFSMPVYCDNGEQYGARGPKFCQYYFLLPLLNDYCRCFYNGQLGLVFKGIRWFFSLILVLGSRDLNLELLKSAIRGSSITGTFLYVHKRHLRGACGAISFSWNFFIYSNEDSLQFIHTK